MQVTIGLGMATSLLLGCSGGVLNVGSNDAGGSGDGAVALETANEACALFQTDMDTFGAVSRAADSWTNYSPAELRSDLIGEWNVCFSIDPGRPVVSLHFRRSLDNSPR